MADDIIYLPWVKDGLDKSEQEAVENLLYMAVEDTGLLSALVRFGWVADGIQPEESIALDELSYIAVDSVAVAEAVISLTWMEDGIEELEAEAIGWIAHFAGASAAEAVVAFPWVLDGVNEVEALAFENLSYISNDFPDAVTSVIAFEWLGDSVEELEAETLGWIANIGPTTVAESMVSFTWVLDGVQELEADTIEEISYFSNGFPNIASKLLSMEWVTNGIEQLDLQAIEWLNNMENEEICMSVVNLGWVQDGWQEAEVKTIEQISYISIEDPEAAHAVVGLGWVADGIENLEYQAIDWMRNWVLGIGDHETSASIIALDWVQDGVRELEVEAIQNLSYIAYDQPDVALSLLALEWLSDDVEEAEYQAIEWITALDNADVAEAVVALPWLRDAVSDTEALSLQYVSGLANLRRDMTLRILEMPFMEAIAPLDALAVQSLYQLASREPGIFDEIATHPTMQRDISDDFVPVLAALSGVARSNPKLLPTLLDPNNTTREFRTARSALSGEIPLTIIRTRPGATRSMDLLEHAVLATEDFLGVPFPMPAVVLLYEEAVWESAAGTHFGTHIGVLPKYDVDDGSHQSRFAPHLIAHEVAHYYWWGNADWVDEGPADFLASIVEERRAGIPVSATNDPCPFTSTIHMLEQLDPARGDDPFTCNYALGERLFVDLYLTLGEERFRQGFRGLYSASQAKDEVNDRERTRLGIAHVKEAFGADDPLVNTVIGRWYDGSAPYDLSRLDARPANPTLLSVNGYIEKAFVALTVDGPSTSGFSAQAVTEEVLLVLKLSYTVYSQMETIDLKIVEYYEDGFAFSRQSRIITAEPIYIGGTYWSWIGASDGWAPGTYYVYVYDGGRKVAEVEYTVTA